METNPKFEDRYFDVLQNIEHAIVSVFHEHTELTDYQVDNALSGLIRVYQAHSRGQPVPRIA